MRFSIGSQFQPTVYLARFLRYWASKILESRLWPFGVTWRLTALFGPSHWKCITGVKIGAK